MALTKEPFSVGFIHTKLPNTHKGEDTEGFTRVAWERGFKDGIAHNTGTPELAWEWKATKGLVHSVSSSHTSSTHPGLCYRVDISRGNDLLSLLYQQARNIKNNNIYNIWKPYFLISYFTWLLEEPFWILPSLHALLSALQVSRSLAHLVSKQSHPQKHVISMGPIQQLMETEENYTSLGQISKFKHHLLYYLMVCQKIVTQSERG